MNPDPEALLQENAQLRAQNTAYEQEVERLKEMVTALLQARYAPRKDMPFNDGRRVTLPVFDEAEALTAAEPEEEELKQVAAHTRRKPGGRRKLPENLPRETVVHDLPEEEKTCQCCQQPLTQIGVDSTEKLEYVPASVKVVVHERPKYGCKSCESAPKQARPEPQAIPKGIATASLLAYILISKFIDAIPLYRQEQQWQRLGIDLGRSLMSGWVIKCGTLLMVLWELMRQDLRESGLVQADETPVQVLREENRTAAQKSYMWLFQCGPPNRRIILYHYAPSRSSDVPADILGENYRGFLQSDGYAGYHSICARQGVTGVACLAHIRRKFVEVTKLHKKKGLAHEAVGMIRHLYAVEKQAKRMQMSAEQRHQLRQEKASPVMAEFKRWLDQHQPEVPPSLKLGKAFTYAQNEWDRMTHYLDDGRIEIDNNAAERAIKPFVIGRKNWLFCNTPAGATTSAVIYSLLQSAKANNLPLLKWMSFVLRELPRCTTDEQRRALLPHRFDPSRLQGE